MPQTDWPIEIQIDPGGKSRREVEALRRGILSVGTAAQAASQLSATAFAATGAAAATQAMRMGTATSAAAAANVAYSTSAATATGLAAAVGRAMGSSALLVDQYGRSMISAGAATAGASRGISGLAGGLGGLRRAALPILAVLGGVAVALRGIGAAAEARNQVVAMTRGLSVSAGTAAAARKEYEFVRQTALRLGLDLRTAGDAYASLTAATKGTNLQGENARRIFSAVSGAMVVLGRSGYDTNLALLAIQQMISKGVVSAEELRRQLGDKLPGAFQLAARAMDMSTRDLNKMLESGELMADVFLPKLAAELERTFGPQVAAASESQRASMNRFKTAVFELSAAVGEALEPAVQSTANTAAGMLSGITSLIEAINRERETTQAINEILDEQAAKREGVTNALKRQAEQQERLAAAQATMRPRSEAGIELAGEAPGQVGGLLARLALIDEAIERTQQSLENLGDVPIESRDIVQGRLETALKDLRIEATEVRDRIQDVQAEMKKLATPAGKAETAIKKMRAEIAATNEKLSAFTATEAPATFRELMREAESTGVSFQGMADHYELLADIGIESGSAQAQSLLMVRKELEALQSQLEARIHVEERAARAAEAAAKADQKRIEAIEQLRRSMANTAASIEQARSVVSETNPHFDAMAQHFQRMAELGVEFGSTTEKQFRLAAIQLIAHREQTEAARKAFEDAARAKAAEADATIAKLNELADAMHQEQVAAAAELPIRARWIDEQIVLTLDTTAAEGQSQEFMDKVAAAWLELNGQIQRTWADTGEGLVEEVRVVGDGIIDQIERAERRAQEARRQRIATTGMQTFMNFAVESGYGGGGTSQFGGRMSGNMSQRGMQIGSAFGPAGAFVGFVLGGLIQTGADDMTVAIETAGDQARARITRAEGGLKEIAPQIANAINGFFEALNADLGGAIDSAAAGMAEIRIRNDRVIVEVAGAQKGFRDLNEALGWMAERILAANQAAVGIGDNVRAIMQTVGDVEPVGNLEELSQAMAMAVEIDDMMAGRGGSALQFMRSLSGIFRDQMDIARRYGLVLEDVLEYQNRQLQLAKEEVDAQRKSLLRRKRRESHEGIS
jgi:tape measure domain-containing protein